MCCAHTVSSAEEVDTRFHENILLSASPFYTICTMLTSNSSPTNEDALKVIRTLQVTIETVLTKTRVLH